MRRSGKGSGGGYGMNKHVERRAPKIEPKARAILPSAVNQLGGKVGDHATRTGATGYRGEELVRGKGYAPPVGPTDNVKAVGVGGGRCGTQGMTGEVNRGSPMPKSKSLFPGWEK
jgi:hypothetical protein